MTVNGKRYAHRPGLTLHRLLDEMHADQRMVETPADLSMVEQTLSYSGMYSGTRSVAGAWASDWSGPWDGTPGQTHRARRWS